MLHQSRLFFRSPERLNASRSRVPYVWMALGLAQAVLTAGVYTGQAMLVVSGVVLAAAVGRLLELDLLAETRMALKPTPDVKTRCDEVPHR